MKIIMKETVPGSVDGVRVSTYEAGCEYDLTATAGAQDLAAAFVAAGLAEEVGAKAGKAAEASPETIDAVEGSSEPASSAEKPARKSKK